MTDIRPLIPDGMAMDEIYGLLDGKEWNADTIDAIAEIVERTGRHIDGPVEEGPWYCKLCGAQIAGGWKIGWKHLGPAEQGHGTAADAHHIAVPCDHDGGSRTDDGGWRCSHCPRLFASYEAWGVETGNTASVVAVKTAMKEGT